MNIQETFVVAADRERVWRFITDPKQMGPLIPGCKGIEVTGPTTYRATVEAKVGPIKAEFNLEVEVTEEVYPDRIRSVTRGEEGTRASTVTSTNILMLKSAASGGTEVTYGAEVIVSGRLGKFGGGVMQMVAKKIGNQFAEAFRTKVEAAEPGDRAPAVETSESPRGVGWFQALLRWIKRFLVGGTRESIRPKNEAGV